MTAPEKIGLKETHVLETEIPGLTVRDFEPEDLAEYTDLIVKDARYIRTNSGVLDPYGFLNWAENITEGNPPVDSRLMNIDFENEIVGSIVIGNQGENKSDISFFIGENHAKKGYARAAVKAVVKSENEKGIDVIADVKRDNVRCIKLMGALGFKFLRTNYEDNEKIFEHKASHSAGSSDAA